MSDDMESSTPDPWIRVEFSSEETSSRSECRNALELNLWHDNRCVCGTAFRPLPVGGNTAVSFLGHISMCIWERYTDLSCHMINEHTYAYCPCGLTTESYLAFLVEDAKDPSSEPAVRPSV